MNATQAILTRAEVDQIFRSCRRRFPNATIKRLLRSQLVLSVRCAEGTAIVYFRGGWNVAPGDGLSVADANALRDILER